MQLPGIQADTKVADHLPVGDHRHQHGNDQASAERQQRDHFLDRRPVLADRLDQRLALRCQRRAGLVAIAQPQHALLARRRVR
ncbi:hypothetical protein D3C80_1420980 [compost metagenome]